MGPAAENASAEIKEGVNFWVNKWEQKQTFWQMKEINAGLLANIDLLTKAPGSKSKKILVPLCGQTLDLLYLLNLGHEVFGIECAVECIQGLADRDGFQFTLDEQDSVYHTADGKLKIFIGDIFEFPIEKFGPFDCVWDRGSLVAMEYPRHKAYVELMKRGLVNEFGKAKTEFRYLLEAFQYDTTLYPGPPRNLSADDMANYFSSWAKVEELSRTPVAETAMRSALPQDFEFNQILYLLSSK